MTATWSGDPKTWAQETLESSEFNTEIRDRFDLLKLLANDDGSPNFVQAARLLEDFDSTNDTTLSDVPGLSFSIGSSENWLFFATLHYEGGTAEDLKLGLTFPSGAAGRYGLIVRVNSPNDNDGLIADPIDVHAFGVGEVHTLLIIGTVANSTTAGTAQLQAAQVASGGTPTKVFKNSSIVAVKVQ